MYLKPAPGRVVTDPVTGQPLPDAGAEVGTETQFWTRRLQDGDVIESKPSKRTEPK